jgi:hypothetical protein
MPPCESRCGCGESRCRRAPVPVRMWRVPVRMWRVPVQTWRLPVQLRHGLRSVPLQRWVTAGGDTRLLARRVAQGARNAVQVPQAAAERSARKAHLQGTREYLHTHARTHARTLRWVPSACAVAIGSGALVLGAVVVLRAAIGEHSGPLADGLCACMFVSLFVGDGGPELPMPKGLAGLPRAHLKVV